METLWTVLRNSAIAGALLATWSMLGMAAQAQTTAYQVLAYNDLGMHCYDSDFSIFSLLPPFNTLHAQVVLKGAKPVLMTGANVSVVYSGVKDPNGSLNTTSVGKTNFWTYSPRLFGITRPLDVGILGAAMPGLKNTPQPMTFDTDFKWASATGIPITNIDNSLKVNSYPLMRIQARPKGKTTVLAQLDVVVPVSSEMDCKACHATGGIAADALVAQARGMTLSTNPNPDLQSRENILKLHDALYQPRYQTNTSLWSRRPVLCASCHYSKALDLAGTGPAGEQLLHENLSAAMHLRHGKTIGNQLPTASNRAILPENGVTTCYHCHPGNDTNCLRSVMATNGMSCQNCHGGLLAVGGLTPLKTGKTREPWADEPKCQSCHTGDFVSNPGGALPRMSAFDPNDASATPTLAPNSRFAENPGTLYRFSKGHGGVTCEGCHGSTHAEWPARDPSSNDNLTAKQIQSHAGPVVECSVCHGTSVAISLKGPHGLHPINSPSFISGHGDLAEGSGLAACQACHGLDLKGTYLSKVPTDRVFSVEGKAVKFVAGSVVSCDRCHGNPLNGGN